MRQMYSLYALRGVLLVGLLGLMLWAPSHKAKLTVSNRPKASALAENGAKPSNVLEGGQQSRVEWEIEMYADPRTGRIPEGICAKEIAFAQTLPSRESLQLVNGKRDNNLSWNARGPWNSSGRVRALAFDIADNTDNTILAGGVSGGMWRTTNGGTSWAKVTQPNVLQSCTSIAQDVRTGKRNIWYYGTGEYIGNSAGVAGASYNGNGVFKSIDNGLTWSQLTSTTVSNITSFTSSFQFVFRVVTNPIAPAGEDHVLAATYTGLYRSTNGGTSWTTIYDQAGRETDITVSSTGVFYYTAASVGNGGVAATTAGILRSTDGVNWVNITPVGFPSAYQRIVGGIAASNENIVYFLAHTPGFGTVNHSLWKYTYVSGDGTGSGGTWVNLSANIPTSTQFPDNVASFDIGGYDSQGGYDIYVRVSPTNPNLVFIGGTNVYRSTDGFATTANTSWIGGYHPSEFLWPDHHPDQHELLFFPNNSNKIVSANDNGVSVANNATAGATLTFWTNKWNGHLLRQFYTIAIDPETANDPILVGGAQDNGTFLGQSTTVTEPWLDIFGGDGSWCDIARNKEFYLISSQSGNVYRASVTNNTFGNYTKIDPIRPGGSVGYAFINPFVLDKNNSGLLYLLGGNSVWRNSDLRGIPVGGSSSTSVNWQELTGTIQSGSTRIRSITTSKLNPGNRIYYGTNTGRIFRMDNAHTGQPTGIEITGTSGMGWPATGTIRCIAVDPNNADNLFAVFSNYNTQSIFHTTNAGTSWTAVSGNLEQNPDGTGNGPAIGWLAIATLTPTTSEYYVGTSTGLYSTTSLNGMSTVWAQEGASTIGNIPVHMVVTRGKDGLVVAATHGNGAYSANTSVSTSVNEPLSDGSYFQVRNWPNPANTFTTFYYNLPKPAEVTLSVFGPDGQNILTTSLGRKDKGSNEHPFSTESLGSGVYIARLSTSDGLGQNVKVIVVK